MGLFSLPDSSVSSLLPQRALGEFPEKELQLQQMEVQVQRILEKTSVEGQVHILRDLKRLRESWLALYNMSLNLHRYLKKCVKVASLVAALVLRSVVLLFIYSVS